jgi:hypothetical protein
LKSAEAALALTVELALTRVSIRITSQPVKAALRQIKRIVMRPAGYFAGAYSHAEIREDNCLAKASVVRAPKDLD